MNAAPAVRQPLLAILGAAVFVAACTPNPIPTPSPPPPVALLPVEITSVGEIPAGRTSIPGMSIQLTEADVATIGRGLGTLVITLADAVGATDTIRMVGTPAIVAPGSLGVTVTLAAPNVLRVEILDSDPLNVEPVTISRLRLAATPNAAPGDVRATITECTGSLAGCAQERELRSPATVLVR